MPRLICRYIPIVFFMLPFFLASCSNPGRPVSTPGPIAGTYLPVVTRGDLSPYVRQRLHLSPDHSYILLRGSPPKTEEEERGSYRVEGEKIFFTKDGSREVVGQGRVHGNGEITFFNPNHPEKTLLTRKMNPAKRHVLVIENGTGDFALVKIKSYFGQTESEMAIGAGGSQACKLPDGNYYEVVRFGDAPSKFKYSKGEGFIVSAPPGQYIKMRLTLHPTPQGGYKTSPASSKEFE